MFKAPRKDLSRLLAWCRLRHVPCTGASSAGNTGTFGAGNARNRPERGLRVARDAARDGCRAGLRTVRPRTARSTPCWARRSLPHMLALLGRRTAHSASCTVRSPGHSVSCPVSSLLRAKDACRMQCPPRVRFSLGPARAPSWPKGACRTQCRARAPSLRPPRAWSGQSWLGSTHPCPTLGPGLSGAKVGSDSRPPHSE
jgi:hypothetical protein